MFMNIVNGVNLRVFPCTAWSQWTFCLWSPPIQSPSKPHFSHVSERVAVTWAMKAEIRRLCKMPWIIVTSDLCSNHTPHAWHFLTTTDGLWSGCQAQEQASGWNNWNGYLPSPITNFALYVAIKIVCRWSIPHRITYSRSATSVPVSVHPSN